MRRVTKGIVVLGVVVLRARGRPTPTSRPRHLPAPAPAPRRRPSRRHPPHHRPAPAARGAGARPATAPRTGLAVVALAGAADAAWPLARSVYADPVAAPRARRRGSRPRPLRRAGGRVSRGRAARSLRHRRRVHGDDAPSRALLDGIARRFGVRALVVVGSDAGHATARVYLAETGAFDAAAYAPDEPPAGPAPSWSATTRSLDRALRAPPGAAPPPQRR